MEARLKFDRLVGLFNDDGAKDQRTSDIEMETPIPERLLKIGMITVDIWSGTAGMAEQVQAPTFVQTLEVINEKSAKVSQCHGTTLMLQGKLGHSVG